MTTEGFRFESKAFRKIHPAEFNRRFLQEDVRQDGRDFEKFRKTTMTKGAITTGNGSATVRIGNTTIVCGIKAEVGEPQLSEPDKGYLVPNIELSPLCSNKFRPGPPSDEAQVLSEHLNRLFNTKDLLDLSTLCIVPDQAVWVLHTDIVCLNYDGNVIDAAIMALGLALSNTQLPKAELDEAAGMVTADESEMKPLQLQSQLYPSTFLYLENSIVADPSAEEEELGDSLLTVVLDSNDDIVNLWKRGAAGFSKDQIEECVDKARKRKAEIESVYNQSV